MLDQSVDMRQSLLRKWDFYCECTKCIEDTKILKQKLNGKSSETEHEDTQIKLANLDRIYCLNVKPVALQEEHVELEATRAS